MELTTLRAWLYDVLRARAARFMPIRRSTARGTVAKR